MTKEEILQFKVTGLISRAAAYLLLNLAFMGTAIANRVNSGELEVVDGEVIHTFNVATTAGGIVKVLSNDSTRAVGSSDFDKGVLPNDRGICVDRIELWYAGESATDATLSGLYNPHNFAIDGTQRFPAKLLNGYFTLFVNNKPVFEKQVSEMISMGREYQGQNLFGELAIPKCIPPGTAIRAQIELPTGVTVGGTNTHYFKLKFKGAVTTIAPGK